MDDRQHDEWAAETDAALNEVKKTLEGLQQVAHRNTGIDPYAFLCILDQQQRLPERIDAKLIVIPDAWGKAN
jgi:hypothetical protein